MTTPASIPDTEPEASLPDAADKVAEAKRLSDAKRRLLAQRLQRASAPEQPAETIPVRPPGSATLIGPEQYSVWLDATLQPDVPTYNEPVTIQYRGALDPALLEAAFNAFVARHEAWRTSFVVQNGEVHQQTLPDFRASFNVIDLEPLGPADRELESRRLAREQAIHPIPLEQAPLFRTTLVRIAPDDWRLHLLLHHLIFDGFSLRRTFLPELAHLYHAFATGTEPTLAPVALQYGDFAMWRREQAASPAMDVHLKYWREVLDGELPVLRLPSDRTRPAVISHRGNVVRFTLSRELVDGLRDLARQNGATLYMALLTTFKLLLFRYAGQDDVIVGSVADGRRRSELEGMMGYILDIFAVRSKPDAALPFATYLKQVRGSVLGAFGASEVPFERVVAAVDKKRDLSHQPIFQTVFAFQPSMKASFAEWDISTTEISTGAAKFDLYVEADEKPTHTAVRIYYSTDLFDAATIERMAGHWETLIAGAVSAPLTPIGDLPLLTPPERRQMLEAWNDQAVALPEDPALRTMHGQVTAQALRTPDAPAVHFASTTLSYRQLEAESDRLAAHLARAGAAPGTLAAIFLDRSEHLVTGLLGILKTGAAYMPLDPGTPAARIQLCLEDGEPAVILTQRSRVASLPATTSTVLVLEDVLEAEAPSHFTPVPPDPESLAYIIHTSGSTGRPKGVELAHAGVVNLLRSMQREPGFTAADILVAVTTISFDIAVLEIFLPLITSGQVVIAAREVALDPDQLAELLVASRATVLQATPATWSALVGNQWPGHADLKALCGGEALNRSLADRLLDRRLELWNVYGPTETTIWSTVRRVLPGVGPIPVGRPIDNTTAFILDARQQPVPVGVPGELYLGGIGVARGYRNKPELTAEKFVRPAIAAGALLYRTGDHALYRLDGTIEVQGRADNQVKIRGYRIELEDVEVNLTAHPAIAFAAAKAWPDETGGYRLAAYLVGVGGPPPSAAELRQFLRGRVADYMIPSDIVALDAMPLTSNGKVDRKQLLEPARTHIALALNDSPLTGEELRLAAIWAELLNVQNIAATDNFFNLGGHSLLLLKLIRLINKEFSIELPIARLFQAPTIEKLAVVVRELAHPLPARQDEWNSLIPLNPHGTRRPFFLVHSLMLYGRLPAALGPDQPFYALQPLPFGSYESSDWVDRMLEDHIRQIKRIQPHGPYQIAGWCFAGWMAYEIARRLEAAGDQVSLLALLDSWCPTRSPRPPCPPKSTPPASSSATASPPGSARSPSRSTSACASSPRSASSNATATSGACSAISTAPSPSPPIASSRAPSTASASAGTCPSPASSATRTSSPTSGSASTASNPTRATFSSSAPAASPSRPIPTPTAAGARSPPAASRPPSSPATAAPCSSCPTSASSPTSSTNSWPARRDKLDPVVLRTSYARNRSTPMHTHWCNGNVDPKLTSMI